jgi:RNA polymerase sigma-70 factor (ECF subfamily)
MPGDSAFMNRLRSGDAAAWYFLSNRFRQRLREMAAAALPPNLGGRTDASDMVQQTFADANKSFMDFRGTTLAQLFEWLAAILDHNVKDAVRRHVLAQRRSVRSERQLDGSSQIAANWRNSFAADHTPPIAAADREEAQRRLLAALESLPPRQRTAVRLRHLEGRSLVDIASELGCSNQAAAAVVARGLRALRAALHDAD